MSDSKHVTYEDAGVDTAEGGRAVDAIKQMVKDTNRPEVIGGIGGFGGLFSVAALKDMEDPILISGTDGVGTKLVLAQIMDRHETVGQDLVAMCVNDILASGAEPLFFLDYVAIGHIEAEHMAKIIKGVADGCKLAGCALVGGEMAEHPGVMAPADYDLAGFTVGVVDRPKMLDPANVRPGDVILGLPSTGVHCWPPRASTSSLFWSCCAVALRCTPSPTSLAAVLPRTSTARSPTTSTPWSPATVPRWVGTFRPSSPMCRARPSSRPMRHARPSTWALACA